MRFTPRKRPVPQSIGWNALAFAAALAGGLRFPEPYIGVLSFSVQ